MFNAPAGYTLTAYLITGSGSSTGIEFYDGNSTLPEDLLASLTPYERAGELITTTTNTMTVRIHRMYAHYSNQYELFLTTQEGKQ